MYHHILHPILLQELARSWLQEESSSFNFVGIVEQEESVFGIFIRTPGILAGIPFINAVFAQLGITTIWYKSDGDVITSACKIAKVRGSTKKLLLAKRVVLNVLSRASGIATLTYKMLEVLRNLSWKGILAGTQKTTPGFRMVEKYALLIGGADMHRYDSSNLIILEENHIAIAGSIEKAVENIRRVDGFTLKIAVRCKSIEEAINAGLADCDIIMLDNLEVQNILRHALGLKIQFPSVPIEVIGEITERNIEKYACPWIDVISSNNLIQGYPPIDFSMIVEKSTIFLD